MAISAISDGPRWLARLAGGLVLLTGLAVLLGWALDIGVLKTVGSGWVAMQANAALCFALLGASLSIRSGLALNTAIVSARTLNLVAVAAAVVAASIGFLTLSEYAVGRNLGIDQLLVQRPLETIDASAPGRMAPATAFNFVVLGYALLLTSRARSFALFQGLAMLGALIGWLGFSQYFYGGEPLLPFAQLAVHTGIGFVALGAGVLCLRPEAGIVALLVSDSAGGMIARRFVPAALLFPIAFASLRAEGQHLGWFGAEAGLSLFAFGNVLAFGGLGWASAALLHRVDLERADADRAKRQSQRLLQALADNITAIIWVKDLQGRYLLINGGYERVFEQRREAIIGKTDYDLLPKEQADIYNAVDRRAMAAGRAVEAEEAVSHGGVLATFLSIKCPLLDDAGKPYALCGISTDITDRKRAEDALAGERTLLRTLIDALPDIVFTKDLAGRFTMCNDAELRHLGFQREQQLLGRTVFDLYTREMAEAFHADDQRALSGQPLFNREELTMDAAGRSYWCLTTKVPLRNRAGAITGLVGISSDVSSIKAVQQSLFESQQRYQTLAESLPHLVWTCGPDGAVDYLSRQWVEYTGRPEEEQLGHAWAEQLHPDDRGPTRAAWAAATARGDKFDVEFRIRRADGVYHWFKTRGVPLRDATGHIAKWFGSNTDIEDYKQADRKLKTQVERLNLLDRITRAVAERQDLDSIFQAALHALELELPVDFGCVFLCDRPANTLVVASVGARSEAVAREVGIAAKARITIDANGLSRCVRGELVHEPDVRSIDFPFPQRFAQAGLFSMVGAPLGAESGVFAVLVVARRNAHAFSSSDCEFIRQLTAHLALAGRQAQLHLALQQAYDDLRASQQAVLRQERLRALGQMASGIAHDINNAISPAVLYAETLLDQEQNLSERGRKMLGTVLRAIDDVAMTVGRMREFYRPREPQLKLVPVQVNSLVPQVVDLTRARWSDMPQQRGVVIRVDTVLADDLPEVLGIDSELREALTNLVVNAVDALPDGGTVTLRTHLDSRDGGDPPALVVLEVEDNGVGMDEMTRQRCLEPFFTTKGERGTGLGLAMVYGTAQRHGADIEIDSTPGRGTTVRLLFPAAAAATDSAPQEMAAQAPVRPLRLLLIDDDAIVLHSLAESLDRDGHAITTASGGLAGIDAFNTARVAGHPFDAVITDLGMPDVDGHRVASEIKTRSPRTPVIMLTGWGQPLGSASDVPLHVDRLLAKPIRIRELRSVLAWIAQSTPRSRTADPAGEIT